KWFLDECTKLDAMLGRMLLNASRSTPAELMAKAAAAVARPTWWEARLRVAKYWLHRSTADQPGWLTKLVKKWGARSPMAHKEHFVKSDWDPPEGLKINVDKDYGWTLEPDRNLIIFSDGSLVDDRRRNIQAGTGLVRVGSEVNRQREWLAEYRAYKITQPANICQAELLGILQSLIWAEQREESRISIFLDSRAAILAVKGERETELIRRIRRLIDNIAAKGRAIEINWTKGHGGNPPNEAADWAANYGRRGGPGSVKVDYIPTPVAYTAREINIAAETELEQRWERKGKGLACNRIGLSMGPKQMAAIMRNSLRLKTADRKKLWELITYHGNVRGYKGRSKQYTGQSTGCRYCNAEKETIAHWLWCEAPKMRMLRGKCFRSGSPAHAGKGSSPTVNALRLVREAVCGGGIKLRQLTKFLRAVVPDWSSGGDQAVHDSRNGTSTSGLN
ncbi:hypothetical protein FOL47_006411, partial [Perkinsus chesapeaki]